MSDLNPPICLVQENNRSLIINPHSKASLCLPRASETPCTWNLSYVQLEVKGEEAVWPQRTHVVVLTACSRKLAEGSASNGSFRLVEI